VPWSPRFLGRENRLAKQFCDKVDDDHLLSPFFFTPSHHPSFSPLQLVLDKFDLAAWEGIVEAAGMPKDVSWVLSEYYPDSVTVSLVVAASEKLGVDAGTVLGIYGSYFISYLKKNSLDKKLHIMGDNLKDFLHNLDYLHGHLQDTFGNVRYRAR
jgi:hypothetical protein